MLMPEEYIGGIRDLNVGRQSANFIGTPVKVESASALRAAALKQTKAKPTVTQTSSVSATTSGSW
jgi:hypothetical protein